MEADTRMEVLGRGREGTKVMVIQAKGRENMKGIARRRQMKRKKGAVKISEGAMITLITKIDYTDLSKISF